MHGYVLVILILANCHAIETFLKSRPLQSVYAVKIWSNNFISLISTTLDSRGVVNPCQRRLSPKIKSSTHCTLPTDRVLYTYTVNKSHVYYTGIM